MTSLKIYVRRHALRKSLSLLPTDFGKPLTIVANDAILEGLDEKCLEQALNCQRAPGVKEVILNPDAHAGYGAPIGCVMVTEDYIYPGPVGYDIKCSMSLLQTDIEKERLYDKPLKRKIIDAICARIPTGAGYRKAPKQRFIDTFTLNHSVLEGASEEILRRLEIPTEWALRMEDARHGQDPCSQALMAQRLSGLLHTGRFADKLTQLGSMGAGNHFISGDIVEVNADKKEIADAFGLRDGCLAFLSHFGSRGFGWSLADIHFRELAEFFKTWRIPFPGHDKEMVYAPIHSEQGRNYLIDLYLASNFASVNHLLVNALLMEAITEVFPEAKVNFIYYISHNIVREEVIDGHRVYVHRKGATRAYPAKHFSLEGTPFAETGHPILLPGNVIIGSKIMVAEEGAEKSCYSINHGAGRAMGRKAAMKSFKQQDINKLMEESGVMTNCRNYPVDECSEVYKNFNDVIDSVTSAKLASEVANLRPLMVIKDEDTSLKGMA